MDSPSLISYMRDAGKKMNPFDSPSCLVNGGKTARKFPNVVVMFFLCRFVPLLGFQPTALECVGMCNAQTR